MSFRREGEDGWTETGREEVRNERTDPEGVAGEAKISPATLQRRQETGQTSAVRWPQAAGGGAFCYRRCSLSPSIGQSRGLLSPTRLCL